MEAVPAAIQRIEEQDSVAFQRQLFCALSEAVTEASGQAAGAVIAHRALDLVRTSGDSLQQSRVAVALARAGEADAARDLADGVARDAATRPEGWRRLLVDVVAVRAELDDADGALAAALEAVRELRERPRRKGVVPSLIQSLADHRMDEQAAELVDAIEDRPLRVAALATLAKCAAVAGQRDLAIATALRGLASLP